MVAFFVETRNEKFVLAFLPCMSANTPDLPSFLLCRDTMNRFIGIAVLVALIGTHAELLVKWRNRFSSFLGL